MPLDAEQWYAAIRDAYSEFRASNNADKHLAAERLLRQYPFLEPDVPLLLPPPGVVAYREAGHYVMAYLIRYGFTDRYVPFDRSLILPIYSGVTIEEPRTDWEELTGSLGSLGTVAQVHLAGFAAERQQYKSTSLPLPTYSPLLGRAKGLLSSYLEEYGHEDEDWRIANAEATKLLADMLTYVENQVAAAWPAIEALAQALLLQKNVKATMADAIISVYLSDEAKQQARARLLKSWA